MKFNLKWNPATIRYCAIFLGSVLLAILAFIMDAGTGLPTTKTGEQILYRNGYGEGKKEEEVTANVDGGKKQKVTVTLQEQEYSQEKTEEILQENATHLEDYILNKNESLDCVRSDLNLITKIPNTSIDVLWEVSDYHVMTAQGEIRKDNLSAGGTVVTLKALLTYQTTQVVQELPICIYPPLLSDQEAMQDALEGAVSERESQERSQKEVVLPEEVNGNPVTWSQQKQQRGFTILLFGTLICGLSMLVDKERIKEKAKKKKRQMILDYPNIINQYTVLLAAGMTAKNAWARMVADYEKKKEEKQIRYAYEEMIYTLREMQAGRTEGECYERFGARVGIPEYMKFGAMLAQNLKKGSKGLAELLKGEAANAFEERKSQAKKLGEEASTKLLFPMILMLLVVFTIIIVPAFLSIQL